MTVVKIELPLGVEMPDNHRIVVGTEEYFRAECFDDPWSTFNNSQYYDVASVPESKTIGEIMKLLGDPPQKNKLKRNRRRGFFEG